MERDMAYFQRRLQERNADPERAQAIDAELWDELGIEQAILVGDMSGFTRLTKKRGILHFLAMHVHGLTLSAPVVAQFGGTMVKSEADNIMVCFHEPVVAARCAIALQRLLQAHNLTVADPDRHLFYCMGIGFGRVLRLADDVFGGEVNVAYKLGEDIAHADEILVSDLAHAAIIAATTEFGFGVASQEECGHVSLGFHRLVVQ